MDSNGMENIDRKVDKNVPCVMRLSSTPYFRQNIVPKLATGIPARTALMPAM